MDTADQQGPKRLPLWRAFLEEHAAFFAFGMFFPTAKMEDELACRADSVEFAFSIAAIRKALRRKGMNFTARGQSREGFLIAPPQTNAGEMQRMQRAALHAMREGVILGTQTPIEVLDAEQRRRHESLLEKMATRLALLGRRAPQRQIEGSTKERPDGLV